MEIFIFLIIGTFILFWNLFAVIGVISTLYWFKTKAFSSVRPASNSKKSKSKPSRSSKAKSKPTKATAYAFELPTISRRTLLLYAGTALVGFALLIFALFSWNSFTDFTKGMLLISATVSVYLLSWLFRRPKEFSIVSRTFLLLASVTLMLSGVGVWNFWLKGNPYLTAADFLAFYSLFAMVIYWITLVQTKRAVYGILALGASSLITVSIALSWSFSLAVSLMLPMSHMEQLLLPIWLGGNIGFYFVFMKLFAQRPRLKRFTSWYSSLLNLLLSALILRMGVGASYILESVELRNIVLFSLFIPLLFEIYRAVKERAIGGLMIEGALLPFKILVALQILGVTRIEIPLGLLLALFTSASALTFIKSIQSKALTFILRSVISFTAIAALSVAATKPPYLEIWSPTLFIFTLVYLSFMVHARSEYLKRYSLRWVSIFLENVALIVGVMWVASQKVWMWSDGTIALIYLVPAIQYFVWWLLKRNEVKGSRVMLYGSAIFLTVGWWVATLTTHTYTILLIGIFNLLFYLAILLIRKRATNRIKKVSSKKK